MIIKLFEVRDRHTLVPVIAIRCDPANEAERWLLARTGYGTDPLVQREYLLMSKLDGAEIPELHYSPHNHDAMSSRTLPEAHRYLLDHFDELESGAVVDVQFILGETPAPKPSERVTS